MPSSSSPRSTRPYAALVLLVVAVLGLTIAAPAQAKPNPGPAADDGHGLTGDGLVQYKAGRYIVLLGKAPAASAPGIRPGRGDQLDARSSRVRAYSETLVDDHAALAREGGFRIDRNYTVAANGFVADLSAKQATDLATDRRVLLVEKASIVKADTWHTPTMLGLTGKHGVWAAAGGRRFAGDGIVIGVIDSGIWPESESFKGKRLTSTPKTKWDISRNGSATTMEKSDGKIFHGECEAGEEFTVADCSTKLIGARYFVDGYGIGDTIESDYISPRDGNGHGTHTTSTAGGRSVADVKVEGRDFGRVTGMAPAARVAMYKALWAGDDGEAHGSTIDLVSAIEAAVTDGVDVINYSISGSRDTTLDAVDLAFEGAAEAGIFVATSAGNSGPDAGTVAHNNPWVTTVAAATHYNFENTVVLGNGKKIAGASIAGHPVPSSPLVDAAAVGNGSASDSDTKLCAPDSLDPAQVEGTIVVCLRGVYDRVAKSAEVKRAGGVGMVLANASPNSLDADFHSVPTVHITDTDASKVYAYLDAAGNDATAEIRLGNLTRDVPPIPQIAGFSSRGPAQSDNGDILKPDISAPGVSVLAAVAPPSNSGRDYDLYSGTSMSSPHIAGLAALLLGLHPRWTPMQVKSAMMTTAKDVKTESGARSTDLFAQGAGFVRPRKFLNPGLFVLAGKDDWRGYITGLGLDTGVPAIAPNEVNLPSMAQGFVMTETTLSRTFTSTRTGTWQVHVNVPGFESTPSKDAIVAKRKGDIEDLSVHFERTTAPLGEFAFGHLTLSGPTKVRLPIALRPVSVKAPSSVGGTGTDGSVDVPITGGFTGDLDVSHQGLVKAQVAEGTLDEGDYTLACVTVGEGSTLAQFDLHAPDPTSDLDMYIYASDSCDPADITAVAGEAATPSAGETFSLSDPPPGTYIVEIDVFAAGDVKPAPYSLRVYDVGGSPEVGDLTVTPDPVPVTRGEETSFDVSWTGLDPASYYLGILDYEGAPNSTFVYVNTH